MATVVAPEDAVIVRAPGVVASLVVSHLDQTGQPFGIEVVGDPQDSLGPGGVRTVFRPILHQWLPRALRDQCARACAVAYVTEHSLQQRYPPRTATLSTSYSSIDLSEDAFVSQPRQARSAGGPYRLVFVGSLEQLYKAPDVLIDAVADAVNSGVDLQLALVGDGKLRPELEMRAAGRSVSERVRFLGHVSSSECLRRELDSADLFVLPSRTEGLPRAMIEAMARGVPCIGSNVGGIPELIAASERVPAGDCDALTKKLIEVLADPARLARLSAENLETARRYHPDALKPRRQAFYQAVRTATLKWQRQAIKPTTVSRADNPLGRT
jgi:glycosyltransferase involved in cell wall biosynthesis